MKLIGFTKDRIGLSTEVAATTGDVGDRIFATDTKDWYIYKDGWINVGKEEPVWS